MTLTASDIQAAIEDYTGLSWSIETDADEIIVLTRSSYVYEFEKRGSSWDINLYDERDSETDPMCSLSPVPEEDVIADIRKLTPRELQRK